MTDRSRRRRLAADLVAAGLLLALPWLLYGRALGLWWSEDDFFQLRFALDHAPAEYSFDPEVWRRLPNRVLSPLLFASYDLDLALFGLDPEAFYGHQLLAMGLGAVAFFLVLRLWLGPSASALGGLLLLLGPPVAGFAPLLMVRHYPEAILLGLLSAWAFVLAARRRRGPAAAFTTLSALLYLVAAIAKEIAVPLPAALVLLPVGTPRRRLRLLAPHAAVAAGYAAYRTWMLGTPVGGYGWAILPGDWPGLVLGLPGKMARELAGPSPWGWAAVALLAVAALGSAVRSRRAALLLAAGLLLAWLPALPVSLELTSRLAATSWLALAAALPFALRGLAAAVPRGRVAVGLPAGLAVVAVVTAAAGNRAAWGDQLALAQRRSAEARGFLELGRGDYLRHPVSSPAAMAELQRFAPLVLEQPAPGGWFYDDLFLCRPRRPPIDSLWAYDPEAETLAEVTPDLPTLRERHCSSIRRGAPLEARFRSREGNGLTWVLGPYEEGTYAFVLEEGRVRHAVPREGGFRLHRRPELTLRVRYDSPAGWVTYSPPLAVGAAPVEWRREGAAPRHRGEPGGRIGGHPGGAGNQP